MSGCGSSRPVPAARRQARVSNKQRGPRALSGLLEVLTPNRRQGGGQGRAGRAGGQGRARQGRGGAGPPETVAPLIPAISRLEPQTPLGVPPQTPNTDRKHLDGGGFGALLSCVTANKSFAGRRPRVSAPCCRDARPGASVAASSAHANGQRRSRQFRV